MTGFTRRNWLLVPGTLCTAAIFDPLLDALDVPSENRDALTLDQPSIAAYRDRLPSRAAPGSIVCGFSLGAIVTAHCADLLAHVHAIVLFGINPYADAPEKRAGRLLMRDQVATMGARRFMEANPPPLFAGDVPTAHATIAAMAAEAETYLPAQTELALSRPGALPALSQCIAPVIILTGTRDAMTPVAQAAAAAEAAPDGRTIALEGLGHYALLEDPSACADTLRPALTLLNEVG